MQLRASRPSRQRTPDAGASIYLGDVLADELGVALGDENGRALEAAHPAGAALLIDEARRVLTDEGGLALIAY